MASAISVRGLHKTFAVKRKGAGLAGSPRAVLRPEWRRIEAVRTLSFEMVEGELLGFIGPNGAGKSTTIKMLTGILHPSGGEAEVLGFTPWRQRRALAYQIGTVFGQRPQLWYHLPAIDTFHLFGKIYELDDAAIRERVRLLADAFDIEPLLETPVRKLSLGQRMRCEVAASLLHRPRLLLLDEPSIGLDVVAKGRIRDTIRWLNAREGVGVLLTSHDAGDIEALCERVIIVNHGQIVFQDSVATLKRRYLTHKVVEVRYADAAPAELGLAGVEVLARGPYDVTLRFDTRRTPVEAVIAHLAAGANLADVTISDPSLEAVIRAIFQAAPAPEPALAP